MADSPSSTRTHPSGQDQPALIDGRSVWADAETDVRSPNDGRLLATVPKCTEDDIDAAVSVAKKRLTQASLPTNERALILDRAAVMLDEQSEEFAQSISAEAAKPITSARTEVQRAVDTIRFSAAAARSLTGEMIPMDASSSGHGRLGFTLRVPIGVVACISPFNFPLNLVCHKIAPGVAAGVAMVLKPASATPLTALKIAHLFEECGLPPGWLNVITCPGSTAQHLVEHEDVSMITFTGSAEVGWSLRSAVPHKRVGLELGNSSPVIVEPDADLELAASCIVTDGFGYSGQTCISVQRVYAHESVHDELLARVTALTAALSVGDPLDDSTVVSSLIDQAAAERVNSWIDEALDSGAESMTGRGHHSPAGNSGIAHPPAAIPNNVVEPTILANVSADMKVSCDEVFGPVIGFSSYSSIDEALSAANGTRYGLQAGVFTTSISTALEAANRLDFGGVIINDTSSYRTDQQPYGGVKDSGNTREGPFHAVQEMTETKTVIIRG